MPVFHPPLYEPRPSGSGLLALQYPTRDRPHPSFRRTPESSNADSHAYPTFFQSRDPGRDQGGSVQHGKRTRQSMAREPRHDLQKPTVQGAVFDAPPFFATITTRCKERRVGPRSIGRPHPPHSASHPFASHTVQPWRPLHCGAHGRGDSAPERSISRRQPQHPAGCLRRL